MINQEKYERDKKTARATLLAHMSDSLLDLHAPIKSANAIWDALDKKYGADDAVKRNYAIGN